MQGEAVKTLLGKTPDTRVLIVRRPDGSYALRPERWRERVLVPGKGVAPRWAPLLYHSSLFGSVEIAEREAYLEFPWLRPEIF